MTVKNINGDLFIEYMFINNTIRIHTFTSAPKIAETHLNAFATIAQQYILCKLYFYICVYIHAYTCCSKC